MNDSIGPEGHHLFVTVHANAVISLGIWANIVEELKRVIINLPNTNWPALQVYGPSNERFGPGSLCVELTIDGPSYRQLNEELLNLPEWFTVPVRIFEVR